jgi:ethanolamine utilization microcompartment shell protein EutL
VQVRTAAGSAALAYLVAVPLHFVYGLAAPVHLGHVGLVALVLLAGTWLASTGMTRQA